MRPLALLRVLLIYKQALQPIQAGECSPRAEFVSPSPPEPVFYSPSFRSSPRVWRWTSDV